jgi:hypothetical protein
MSFKDNYINKEKAKKVEKMLAIIIKKLKNIGSR